MKNLGIFFQIATEEQIQHAWTKGQFLKILASGGAVDEALRALARAADHVNHNTITVDQITARYCKYDILTSNHIE